MVAILLLSACAGSSGTDYRAGWRAIACETFTDENGGWFAELDVAGEPRPVQALVNYDDTDRWAQLWVSEWSPASDSQLVEIGSTDAKPTCIAWAAE